MTAMKRKQYTNVVVLLCIAYGAAFGVLGFAHASGVGLFAVIGVAILGLGWVGMGMFTKPDR